MGVYDPPIAHYAHVNVAHHSDGDMLRFMGKEGNYFKWFTDKNDLQYVWWNPETKVIELWGSHSSVAHARPYMVEHLTKFENSLKYEAEKSKVPID